MQRTVFSGRTRWLIVALCGLLLASTAGQLVAQSPAGVKQTGFSLIDDYVLEVSGKSSRDAALYASSQTPAILVLSQDLPAPVLLWPRSRQVETLQMLKVTRLGGGAVEIFPDPVIAVHSPFRIEGPEVRFVVDGIAATLTPKPPLVGLYGVSTMADYSAAYRQRAEAYTPVEEVLEKLRADGRSVRVRVFFGTWCPTCGQMVPRIMKVAQRLGAESSIQVEFYGLPRGFAGDPEAEKYGIEFVPSGIVFVDGKELGRINGDQWRSPERTLVSILGIT